MRSRLVEERLTKARTQGLEQLVILGAGLDSTAYRCTDQLDGYQYLKLTTPRHSTGKKPD